MKTIVMKFGGTSVGSPEAIRNLAQIVRTAQAGGDRPAVVVSALSGVTDLLLTAAHAAAEGDASPARTTADTLRDRHHRTLTAVAPGAEAVGQLISDSLDQFVNLCQAISVLGEASPRALDAIASLGERMSAPLVAAALEAEGIPATAINTAEVVLTDSHFLNATPDMDATRERAGARIQPVLDAARVPVLTGFIGADRRGAVTTLGRGGSDYSAAILGVALAADEVWIWTDVNGVMTTDPRIAPDARTIPVLTYREISELAHFGAKVLHPKTIRPVVERGIALWVKNTFEPANPGTRIVLEDDGWVEGGIRAVTAIKAQCVITLEGRGMLGIPGIAARTFAAVARTRTSVSLISQASSEQSICFVVPFSASQTVVAALEDEFRRELAGDDLDGVTASDPVAIITVVGAGMVHTPGVSGRMFSALGNAAVNVVAIAQGGSECGISCVVSALQADDAVRAIHQLIV
ncbi:MAG: aspartate kinase [Anaerolineales bacterium]|nr:aspartate kinase [Anaerolineales bacterium]